jgi:hypothetical protein
MPSKLQAAIKVISFMQFVKFTDNPFYFHQLSTSKTVLYNLLQPAWQCSVASLEQNTLNFKF